MCHAAANFFCSELGVDAVSREIVGSGCRTTESRVQVRLERHVCRRLVEAQPNTWCCDRVGSSEAALGNELLGLSGV